MSTFRIELDRHLPLSKQPNKGHNRWHPGIPPIQVVKSGDVVVMDTLDAFDCQIGPDTQASELRQVDLGRVHPLTGPIYVEGAEPGDILAVDVLNVEASSFAYTVNIPGFGFLRDSFREPFIVRWHIEDNVATSPDLPKVHIHGNPFMGVMGTSPSSDLLKVINEREEKLKSQGGAVEVPSEHGAVPTGHLSSEAIRTIAPHETGGNVDIKQLTKGTTVYLPVYVSGALFSAGDAHFAQGDNECCGTAIEMAATLTVRLRVLKGEASRTGQRDISFSRDILNQMGPNDHCLSSLHGPFYATTGICVDRETGVNYSENLTSSTKNALWNMINYIHQKYGYSNLQAYCLCSVAVDFHVSQLPDIPNVLVSAILPLDIFE
ncbi:Formamidase [Galdieria sulphuraria]|uniref:Formamidase n=1 Tax=Galdieria sulphuraria TaxID=130081 RepID=M2WZU6_GALSU|nr:formamidase [Galdieria sulphuraria]EME29605.1 formamidase [Galdieria sulphuraria]GJD12798.1 Formamidase [Galdieria sulphuraria]|eukprot:XP_005706125.1 formamidase [Galdieria sulphuraria]